MITSAEIEPSGAVRTGAARRRCCAAAVLLALPMLSLGTVRVACEEGAGAKAAPVATGATEVRTVVELFTSQGCSSCPPADALLRTYAARPDVVALSYSVDYWDYLGWKDTLANPKFSARQRSYAKHRGDGRIYTPQVVINGITHANGSSARDIDHAIAETTPKISSGHVSVEVQLENGRVVIDTGPALPGSDVREGTVWLAILQREVEVQVGRGENGGHMLKYVNVVRDLTPVGMWTGKAARIELDRETLVQPGATGCAVLLQHGKAGPIIGAALLRNLM